MFKIYQVLRGTLAFNIFIGVVILYLVYELVQWLDMNLLSLLLGKFVAFGVIILIIIFQPEVRRFLLMLGNTTLRGRLNFLNTFFGTKLKGAESAFKASIDHVFNAMKRMSESRTGALILIANQINSESFKNPGVNLDAEISQSLIENIFVDKAPLHDGAVLISNNRIVSASVILPVSDASKLSKDLGLRHRAGIGVSESSNAAAFIVSEETGQISYAFQGQLRKDIKDDELHLLLKKHFEDSI